MQINLKQKAHNSCENYRCLELDKKLHIFFIVYLWHKFIQGLKNSCYGGCGGLWMSSHWGETSGIEWHKEGIYGDIFLLHCAFRAIYLKMLKAIIKLIINVRRCFGSETICTSKMGDGILSVFIFINLSFSIKLMRGR